MDEDMKVVLIVYIPPFLLFPCQGYLDWLAHAEEIEPENYK